MNDSIYGKTMENLRKRLSVRFVNIAKDYKKLSKPNFVSQEISSENFVVIHETKLVLTLDKAIYKGFSILELSKLLMHEFDYNYIERKCNANLLFTSTDIFQFMKLFIKIKNFLILVIIQKIQSFLILSIKKLLAKWKMNSKKKILVSLLD